VLGVQDHGHVEDVRYQRVGLDAFDHVKVRRVRVAARPDGRRRAGSVPGRHVVGSLATRRMDAPPTRSATWLPG
jgi:hypothetical protein